MTIEELIKEKGGEQSGELNFGKELSQMTAKERREFYSRLCRQPKSGGHQKIKAYFNASIELYKQFVKENQSEIF